MHLLRQLLLLFFFDYLHLLPQLPLLVLLSCTLLLALLLSLCPRGAPANSTR
jgi:hypothetical protein